MATSGVIASNPSAHLQCPPSYSRSRSSGSSASSLSSTFSDLTSSTSAYSSSPPTSKTKAFFASPFSTPPPSPKLPTAPPPPPQPRSLTADFFATPARTPSPPSSLRTTGTNAIHPSRIFPSRYTSTAYRSPEPNLQHLDEGSPSLHSHTRVPSSGSDSSFLSSFVGTRLPTPPPPPPSFPRSLHRDDTITSLSTLPSLTVDDESTPRPPDLQPGLLHFERSLLLAAQEEQSTPPEPEPKPEPEEEEDDEEPSPGSIISLQTLDIKASQVPLSPLSMTFTMASPTTENNHLPVHGSCSTPTPAYEPSCCDNGAIPLAHPTEPTNGLTHAPTLRLVRCLGHGAFSAVWLAEDLSPVPLTVLSKRSVRDLRRRASGRVKEREQERRRDLGDQTKAAAPKFAVDKHETKAQPEPTKRTPSRLREGLRNILSFSRPSASGSSRPSVSNGHPLTESNSKSIADASDFVNASVNSERSEISSSQSFEGASGHSSLRIPLISDANGSLARDASLRKFRDRVRGTRPPFRFGRAYLDERDGEMGEVREEYGVASRYGDGARLGSEDGDSILVPSLSRNSSLNNKANQRLLAVKMTPRKVRGARGREKAEEERTRVGFVREVEVLKHISHPNITPLLAHLSTVSHHILVLPYLQGGDLLGLVNNEVAWGKLGESVLQRIWCELCKAVGWMHGVGLVHRDIKLENILLTTTAFASLTPSSPRPSLSSLPPAPTPFIKLTDFGLSRFVEIDANGEAELLSTRCGSEAYAAPELVTGGRGAYDARQTDAWACGVVLYALVGRQLPFGEGVRAQVGHKIGGERETELSTGKASASERRQWLMRIARGEYEWPGDQPSDAPDDTSRVEGNDRDGELVGPRLIHSVGARRIVGRLLMRDPKKRARIGDLWDDDWMHVGEDQTWLKDSTLATTEGEITSPISTSMSNGGGSREHDVGMGDGHHHNRDQDGDWIFDEDLEHSGRLLFGGDSHGRVDDVDQDGEEEEEEEEEGGWLLDQEGIDNIARQEVI